MIGSVTFGERNGAISVVSTSKINGEYEICESPLIKQAHQQLIDYLNGKRDSFNLHLNPQGTPFQQQVWKSLLNIPYGETRSYKQIAESIGHPKAVRAVGMACNRNPILIIIPCHRVIGVNGSLKGYASGLHLKEFLLEHEKNNSHNIVNKHFL